MSSVAAHDRTSERAKWFLRVMRFSCVLVVFATCCCSATAKDRPLSASAASTFDLQGKVRFCYDRDLEIIYFKNEVSGRTVVEARSIDGHTRTIFELARPGDQRSLSCSSDGSTIAALDNAQDHLYIYRSSQISIYRFDRSLLDSAAGQYSLLSRDGASISVPGDPIHVSGPDVLKQMQFLKTERGEHAFFEGGSAYVDRSRHIDLYQYSGESWRKLKSISKPSGFYVQEIARCGNHVVASLSDDSVFRFKALDEDLAERDDWLNRVGFRKLLKEFNNLMVVNGGYERCAFPLLRKRDVRKVLLGIVTFDDENIQRFAIKGSSLAMSDDEVRLSKDGCYALLMAFKSVPKIPEFTLRQQAVVLKLAAPGCKA